MKLVALFVMLVLASQVADALAITPSSVLIYYVPGTDVSVDATVMENAGRETPMYISARNDSALASIIEITEPNQFVMAANGNHRFHFVVHLPESIDVPPGINRIIVLAAENFGGAEGGISASAAVGIVVKIMVPYAGPYATVSLAVPDSKKDSVIPMDITVMSQGNESISELTGSVEIFSDDKRLASLPIDPLRDVEPNTEAHAVVRWDTRGFPVGLYKAVATLAYAGTSKTVSQEFRIGTENIAILNITSFAESGTINKFNIQAQSQWNQPINNIYADIAIQKDGHEIDKLKTVTDNIGAWEVRDLSAFWDAQVPPGTYDVRTTLHFMNKKVSVDSKVEVIPGKTPVVAAAQPAQFAISTTTVLIIALAVIVLLATLVNMLVMLKIREKK